MDYISFSPIRSLFTDKDINLLHNSEAKPITFCKELYICSGALKQLVCRCHFWQFTVKISGLQMALCNEHVKF